MAPVEHGDVPLAKVVENVLPPPGLSIPDRPPPSSAALLFLSSPPTSRIYSAASPQLSSQKYTAKYGRILKYPG